MMWRSGLILVRRFEDAEPAFSSVGAEETGGFGTPTMLQNISYTYDGVGNITQITDRSDTGAGKSVTFGYDDLHRLTLASTDGRFVDALSQQLRL